MTVHWSVVVIICVALACACVLAALKLIDPTHVAEATIGIVLWLSRSPLETKPPAPVSKELN